MSASPLLAWIDKPSARRGIHFAQAKEWELWTYDRLAHAALAVSAELGHRAVRPNDVVMLVGRSGPELVATLFGVMLAGATPSPIAPPLAFQDRELYRAHLRGVLQSARPALVVVDSELADDWLALTESSVEVTTFAALVNGPGGVTRPPVTRTADIALLQFTSGSSGTPRGVRVSNRALEANVAAINSCLRQTERDVSVSWLPLYHDMGLIGTLLSAVAAGADFWLLRPEQFVRHPLRYLTCLSEAGATLTVTTNFGLDVIVRRVGPDAVSSLDLSFLRGVVVGAERIDARTLEAFADLLAPCGLRRGAFLPAYGLAEATLAVTLLPLDEEWTGVAVEPESLAPGREVRLRDVATADGPIVVGCGRPVPGVSVFAASDDGDALPDGRVGQIVVRGTSLAEGYSGDAGSSLTAIVDGELRTGDAGFVLDGQLFVLGRLGDSIKVRGRMVFSEDLENALGTVGAPLLRMAILLGVHAGLPTAVLVSEVRDAAWLPAAEALLTLHTDGARVVLVSARKGAIVRTSSGKPKRRQLWTAWIEGALAAPATCPGNELVTDQG